MQHEGQSHTSFIMAVAMLRGRGVGSEWRSRKETAGFQTSIYEQDPVATPSVIVA